MDSAEKESIPSLSTLEEWCGMKYQCVIYDSDKDGQESSVFTNKILNKSNLYFINYDDNNCIYGGFQKSAIKKLNRHNLDNDYFLFTLNEFGQHGVEKKYSMLSTPKYPTKTGISVFKENDELYYFADGFGVYKSFLQKSYTYQGVANQYEGAVKGCFNGKYDPNRFVVKRVLVIQMN